MRSGRFHGARLRGGIIGDQEVVFEGLISRVKLSSLTDVAEMSGFTRWSERPETHQMSLLLSPKSFGAAIGVGGGKKGCKLRKYLWGEKDGATGLEGRADCLY